MSAKCPRESILCVQAFVRSQLGKTKAEKQTAIVKSDTLKMFNFLKWARRMPQIVRVNACLQCMCKYCGPKLAHSVSIRSTLVFV